jgi:hypothetical protein
MSKFWILNCITSLEQILKETELFVSIDPGIRNLSVTILNKDLKVENFHKIVLNKNSLIYQELTERLGDIFDEISDKRSCLLIEKQLSRGGILPRIQQHIIAYFMIKKPDMPIIELDSKNRTNMLKDYYKKNKVTKKDSVSWVTEKFKNIDDMKGFHIIKSLRKKDDFADTVCQVYSLLYCMDLLYEC